MKNDNSIREQPLREIVDIRRHIAETEKSETGCKPAEVEELYKTLAESSLAAIFIVQDGKFRFINTSAIAYAGYTAEELIGQDSDIIVHPEDREKVKRMSREMLSGTRNAAFDFRMVTKQNHIRWISQTVTSIQYGGRPAILGNAIDVTDLKQAEELYKTLAESSFAAVFIVQDGKFRFINTSAIAYAGYNAEEFIGQDSDFIVHPEDREKVKRLSREMLSGARNAAFEFRMVTKAESHQMDFANGDAHPVWRETGYPGQRHRRYGTQAGRRSAQGKREIAQHHPGIADSSFCDREGSSDHTLE